MPNTNAWTSKKADFRTARPCTVLFALLISMQLFSRPAHAGMRFETIEPSTEEAILDEEQPAKPRFRGHVGAEMNYTLGINNKVRYKGWFVPLYRVEYDEWLYFHNGGGTQAGVWLRQTPDPRLKFGVSVQTRPGRAAFDPSRRRKGSIDGAINFQWRSPEKYSMQFSYFRDIGGVSQGQSLDFSFSRHIVFPHALFNHDCMIVPGVALEWDSAKLVDHYYGVSTDEATPDRPAYEGRDTVNAGARITGFYLITKSWTAFAGIHALFLGNGITDSPIVERHNTIRVYFGSAWLF